MEYDDKIMGDLLKNVHQLNAIQPFVSEKLKDLTVSFDAMNRHIDQVDKDINIRAAELKIYFGFLDEFKKSAEAGMGFPWCKIHNKKIEMLDEKITWMKRFSITAIVAILAKIIYDVWFVK